MLIMKLIGSVGWEQTLTNRTESGLSDYLEGADEQTRTAALQWGCSEVPEAAVSPCSSPVIGQVVYPLLQSALSWFKG